MDGLGVFLLIMISFVQAPSANYSPPPPFPQGGVLFPSYRYNNRNFWLEYSTPPTTLFPEYDDYSMSGAGHAATTTPDPGPKFVEGAARNHSVRRIPLGSTVFLDCRIKDLMDYQVSWFRRQNSSLNVLTIGRETFSADDRYSLSFRRPDNWRLKIRPTVKRDNGTYLCQVSRHPPILLITHLKIIVPLVHFVDEEADGRRISEKHYKPGSTIELHCVVKNYLPEFKDVVWQHMGSVIKQSSKRGGISIKTKQSNGTVSSHLYLATAAARDSGVYSYSVANLAKAELSLHILNGEEPAAIQSSHAPEGAVWKNRRTSSPLLLPLLSILVIFRRQR